MKEDMSKIGCHKNKGEVIDKEEEHTDKKEENSWTTRGTSTMEEQHTDKKEEKSWTNRGTSIIEENDDDDDLL